MIKQIIQSWCLLGLACLLSIQAPRVHRSWLRNKVANQVVSITNPSTHGHGGTGVHVKTKQGVVILTNDHICTSVAENGIASVKIAESSEWTQRKVLRQSDSTDLCIIEGLPGAKGLELAKNFDLGVLYYMIGHPNLEPITMVEGELIAAQKVQLFDRYVKDDNDCTQKKNERLANLCFINITGFQSTLPTYPGNSGSPLVNIYGQVIGLVYLTNHETMWGSFISLFDIKDFLK